MIRYVLTEHFTEIDDRPGVPVCGIAAMENEVLLDEIADISADRALVSQMADTLTCFETSVVHFRDVVEDLLAQI